MRGILCALSSVSIFVLVLPAVAQNQDTAASLVLACDRAAASPSDTNRPAGIAGVPSDKLDPQIAIAACEAAATVAPNDPRIMFQLGRAHAAAKAYESARVQFSRASDLDYAAAQANLGFFYAAGLGGLSKDDREASRLFKLAAGKGFIHNQLAGKRLGLLLDLVPDATTIGYLVGFNGSADADTKGLLEVARSVGREVIVIECRGDADFEAAFEKLSQRQAGGLIVSAFPLAINNRHKVVALAARYKVPTIYAQSSYAYQGGLMSYMGVISERDVVNQYVMRILKGDKPADLPIQTPRKFELILNLRTAKALGLAVPPAILVNTDKVIE